MPGSPVLRDALIAGSVAGVLSGAPSTLHALARGDDPLEASLAAGTILLPGETRTLRLLPAAAVTHLALSLGWATVLAIALPRRRIALWSTVSGLAVATLDLGIVGDLETGSLRGVYRVNGDTGWTDLGATFSPTAVMRWFSPQALAGVLVSHAGSTTPIVGVFDSFGVSVSPA